MADRLLDTNIVSYLFKGHTLASRYLPHLTGHTLLICFMTVAELYEGAPGRLGSPPGEPLGRLPRVVPHDPGRPGRVPALGEVRAGRRAQPIGVADAWIAAAALVHGLELVTHNPADFQGIAGLSVISEAP